MKTSLHFWLLLFVILVTRTVRAETSDDELNKVYQQVLTAPKMDPQFLAELRKAQEAWLTYRDSWLDLQEKHSRNTDENFRKWRRDNLNRQRMGDLRSLLSERVNVTLISPKATPIINGHPIPQPIRLSFSSSVAPLNAIHTANPKGIALTPAHDGEWIWTSDSVLEFHPSKDWPAGTSYDVVLDDSLLVKNVLLQANKWTFTTPQLNCEIVSNTFYTDPKNPEIHQVVEELHFNYPVDAADLTKFTSVTVVGGTQLFTEPGGREPVRLFEIEEGSHHRQFWIRTAAITLPEREDFVRINIRAGLPTTNQGVPMKEDAVKSTLVPDASSGFTIAGIKTQIVRTSEGQPEQLLFVDTNGFADTTEIAKHLQAWILPKDKPADILGPKQENFAWEKPGMVKPEYLRAAKPINLLPVETKKEDGDDTPHSTTHVFKLQHPEVGWLYAKISSGIKALGGFRLGRDFVATEEIAALPKELEILGNGGLLALNGERKISLRTRGIQHLRFTLARIPFSQINHFARFTYGEFQAPNFKSYIDEENLGHFQRIIQDVPMRSEQESDYVSFDMAPALKALDPSDPDASRGMFLLTAEAVKPRESTPKDPNAGSDEQDQDLSSGDPALVKWVALNSREGRYGRYYGGDNSSVKTSEERFVLITDLGLIVKTNQDRTHDCFVQSVQKGDPLKDVTIYVLAKNGEFITQVQTDANGHAHLDNYDNLNRERTPVAFVARLGNDIAFMRYRREDRQLDFSRFDTGGLVTSELSALDGFLFTERGVYRPGEAIHVAGIVRQRDWSAKLEGLPLIVEIYNSKNEVIDTRNIALPSDGFFTVDSKTSENDPTGPYSAHLYMKKDKDEKDLLFRRVFRVEEFQPDRMKMTIGWNVPEHAGWIAPDAVTANVTLQNLFGLVAADRRIKADLQLNPAAFAFEAFPGFTFHNRLDQESRSFAGQNVPLGEKKTEADGVAAFDLDLQRFNGGCFSMEFMAEGFEADGGRSVRAAKSVLVSPFPYVIGSKPDGDLSYVGKDAQRRLKLIAINSDLKPIEAAGLTQRIIQTKFVSVLTKQRSGSYEYVSTKRESVIREAPITIPAAGTDWDVPTSQTGDFRLEISNDKGEIVSSVPFNVVGKGNANRTLDRNAELQLKLAKTKWNSGEQLELNLNAPYTGAGLITLERDKVLAWQWFKSPTTASMQHIQVPPGLEGTNYVNVSFVRALDSPEVFMSPLSYAVAPFTANPDLRKLGVTLDAVEKSRPGTPLRIGYTMSKRGRIIIFAVDAGIHQITDYKLPQPLPHFFRKRALEVDTAQILDQILPEFSMMLKQKAFGGDGGALKRHLNPFKRRKDAPVVFWSGLVEGGPERKEVTYKIPDYFDGKLDIMAVAVTNDEIGAAETSSVARGPMVLTPNVPVFAAPGDEFTASLTLANNLEGANATAPIQVVASGDAHLKILDGQQTLTVPTGREGTLRFHVQVIDNLGGANLSFKASAGAETVERHATLSVRPASTYITAVQSGYTRAAETSIPVTQSPYPEFRKCNATISALPIGLARGLEAYLQEYPHGCSEQITSRAMSRLILSDEADFGYNKADAVTQLDYAFALLRTRQNAHGGFGYWTNYCPDGLDYLTVYVSHFLTEAKEAGYAVPADLLDGARQALKQMASFQPNYGYNLEQARIQAAAIYLLTRQGEVTTNYLLNMRDQLDRRKALDWQSDLVAVYLASTYALLKQEAEGLALYTAYRAKHKVQPWERWYGWYYSSPQVREAEAFALACRHFPAVAGKFTIEDLSVITQPISKNHFNTISSAWSILALKSYSQLAQKQEVKLSISELAKADGTATLLNPPSGHLMNVPISAASGEVRFEVGQRPDAQLGAFYQLTESGFEKGLPTDRIADGMEIFRDLRDANDQPITDLKVGQPVTVHIHIRNLGKDPIDNIAIVDLMPGGFEIEGNSLKPGSDTVRGADFVEVREDRNVLFCNLSGTEDKTFTYRIKPVAAGTFAIPPVFAEQMYDRSIRARTGGAKITVLSAQ